MTNRNTSRGGRGERVLMIALIAANLLLLVVNIITIPPNLQGMTKKADPPAAAESTSPIVTQEPEQTDTPDPKDTPDRTDTPDPTDKPAPTNTPTPTDAPQSPGAEAPPATWSTEERPNLGDFLWYTEDVLYNGVPSNTNPIDSLSSLTGSWKALILYDPDNEFDSNAMEFLNISFAGTEDDVSLTFDWYLIYWANEGESFDETSMEDTVFNGKWENGGLWASGVGTIRLTQFYEQNQKQRAVGTMDMPDGIPALIALVRP